MALFSFVFLTWKLYQKQTQNKTKETKCLGADWNQNKRAWHSIKTALSIFKWDATWTYKWGGLTWGILIKVSIFLSLIFLFND